MLFYSISRYLSSYKLPYIDAEHTAYYA